ncbi:MAG: HU family DNA-binding protein [Bacteroidaceae bacterium]|nr:HU family DNA-binding protein [Bacteroidaceae bacterium]
MAVIYRTYQDNRDGSITQGQWFGRAVHTNTIDLEAIGEEIQENVSVKYSDVMGVLIELINVMNRHLNASEVVKLNGFGSFKIGLKTKGALREEDFTAVKNIVGARVNFLPYYTVDGASGKHNTRFLSNVSVKNIKDLLPKEDDNNTPNP